MNAPVRPKVSSVAIELTGACNQKCDYCYNGFREDNGESLREASTETVLARIDKLTAELDVDHVTLTGGEPFLRADIFQILDLLKARGVGVQFISNGGVITERIAARLAPYQPTYIQITLNGHTPALHAEHVGGDGHFEKTLQGISLLRKHGVVVVGCVVVTRKNGPHLDAILRLWHQLGITHLALSRFSPAGYAVDQASALLPTRTELMSALEIAAKTTSELGLTVSCTMPVPPCLLEASDYAPIQFGSCPIGTSMQEFALGPDGKLRNCTLHDKPIGGVDDILADDVQLDALVTHQDVTGYQATLPEFCVGCIHAESCGGGCGAAALWMLAEDPEGRRYPDPIVWRHVDEAFGSRMTEADAASGANAARRRLDVVS